MELDNLLHDLQSACSASNRYHCNGNNHNHSCVLNSDCGCSRVENNYKNNDKLADLYLEPSANQPTEGDSNEDADESGLKKRQVQQNWCSQTRETTQLPFKNLGRRRSKSGATRNRSWAQITVKLPHLLWLTIIVALTPFSIVYPSSATTITNPLPKAEQQTRLTESDKPQLQLLPPQNQSLTLEIVALLDSSMTKYHKFDTLSYTRVLLSIAAGLFKDKSLDRPIQLQLVGFEELTFNVSNLRDSLTNPEKNLITELRRRGQDLREDPDAILILTRKDLCWAKRCSFSGFAFPGNVCSGQNVAVVKDEGFYSGYSIAHELGHLLNMNHGMDEKTCDSSVIRRVSYGYWNTQSHSTLTSYVDFDDQGKSRKTPPWQWSACSSMFLQQFLASGNGSCLTIKTQLVLDPALNLEKRLPGQIYNLDEQCEKLPGENGTWSFFRSCSFSPAGENFMDCSTMSCVVDTPQGEKCRRVFVNWADGTLCNSTEVQSSSIFGGLFRTSDTKICKRGTCIYLDDYYVSSSNIVTGASFGFQFTLVYSSIALGYLLPSSHNVFN